MPNKFIVIMICASLFVEAAYADTNYMLLDKQQYDKTVKDARQKIETTLHSLADYRNQDKNQQIAHIARLFTDKPYLHEGAMGEGDWQSHSMTYQPGETHINQQPVYRVDGFDCQTFVQVSMGLLYSRTLKDFDKNIIKIAYDAKGARGIHFYNRNHFVDGDFNPVNQRQGYLLDVTANGELAPYAKTAHALLNRQQWFSYKQDHLLDNVQVLQKKDGERMAERFLTDYSNLPERYFSDEKITISYLPKEKLAFQKRDGSYQPNEALLQKIPTPAIAEIVYDTKRWNVHGKNIKELIGTELTIGHFGLLYRDTFQQGEIIYQKITCDQKGNCVVKPVICLKKRCDELMFAHATAAYPRYYFWYQNDKGDYRCTREKPAAIKKFSYCNRVEQRPLFAYLTDYQYNSYWYMTWPAILGVHIEKLL